MSISVMFGSSVLVVPSISGPTPLKKTAQWNGGGGLVIECSSRPQKKATAHHRKTRPRKTQAWDIRRKPTVYPQLPPLPPDWTLEASSASGEGSLEAVAPPSPSTAE
ncbi:large ribosomal subunit protein cL38 [Corylus avellana]|uniref:large ribosomal subunit protein cL38 n=1 Tax=Corylus avellana TaxID=13451 RepID=UPI001E213DBD|nr:large ribosomal subunit protein cL38 [Corylus avellana]